MLFFIYLFILFLDQGVKWFVIHSFPYLVVYNLNGTWGILPSWVSVFSFLLTLGLWKNLKSSRGVIGGILVAGISNFLDRFTYGGVVDFIHVGSFPVFNLADVIICCGIGWVMWREWGNPPRRTGAPQEGN